MDKGNDFFNSMLIAQDKKRRHRVTSLLVLIISLI